MQEIEIQVENDHIARITSARPLQVIAEMVWNSYDADAKKVTVEFETGDLTKLGKIRISDNGDGIPFDEVESSFQSLGGSWKKNKRFTDGGRAIHGEKGQGRFKAFALGNQVKWISKSQGFEYSITGHSSNLKKFTVSDRRKTSSKGCVVEISDITKDFEIQNEHNFDELVRDIFALQLYEDREFELIYDGVKLDASESIREVTPYELTAVIDEKKSITGKLEIVEWNNQVDRKLMLCLPGRFTFYDIPPAIHARGFNFTAYLTAEHFQKLNDDNTAGLVELDPNSLALIDAAKTKLREHFRSLESERSREKINEWKKAEIYPYAGNSASSIERNERQVFDVVALNLADYSSDFDKSSLKQKKLVLQLLKAAIETGGNALPSILEKIIDLPQSKQTELADLLKKTSLTAVINASKSVTNRLDFIRGLQLLIFDPKSKKQLLERSQLHKILTQETWIFGEQYNLTNDDQDLTAVLRTHLKCIDKKRKDLNPLEPVLDADGKVAIIDLMLSCRIPTPTDDERKHLVVELKRPAQPINEDGISQIKKYAKAVALDNRFKNSNAEWDFVAVSNSMTEGAELEARQANKPRGLVFELDEPKIRVWAKTWGEIIDEASGRLTFYKRQLEYQANDADALRYLKNISDDYLSDEIKEKIIQLDKAGT